MALPRTSAVPPMAPRPAQEPAPVAERIAAPEAPVVPPSSLPPVDPALAKQLGSAGLAKLEVAMSVCAAAVRHDGGKLRVGCRACPPFGAKTGPDGHVALDPDGDDGFYELEAVYPGSFSKPGASEIAAVFSGCESHAENWGGTLFAERRGPVWVAASYKSGFHPLDCQPVRLLDSRDLLVCRWETDHQSYVNWFLDSYDLTLASDTDPDAGWKGLLALGDNSYVECWGEKDHRLVVGEMGEFRVEPARAGRPPRVIVKVTLANEPQTAAYSKACKTMLANEKSPGTSPHSVLKLLKTELVLTWNGTSFALDASSRAVLDKYTTAQVGSAPAQ